jgi:oxygen-independent coproporphyrinogen-3 oxidase
MLEVDQDSRLGREILSGGPRYGAPEVPGEDAVAELYQIAVERLAAIGLGRYEISNFARPGLESQHNLKYWRLEPYVGFGADAHSFDGAMRSRNVESPEEYLARGEFPREETVPAKIAEERFFVGLRLSEGIRPTAEEWQRHAGPIRRFLDAGLLASDGETLRLTERGVMLSNEVFQEFIET